MNDDANQTERKAVEEEDMHWLVRPSTIRKLWAVFVAVLALSVGAQLVVHLHEYFRVDDTFGFYASFGFISCLAMVVFAKLLGLLLKRPDNFYDDDH